MPSEPDHAIATSDSVTVQAAVDFLSRHPPFDRMEHAPLAALARHFALGYWAAGRVIVSPAAGVAERVYIVQQGDVRRSAPDGADAVHLGPGELFPLDAVLERRATRGTFTADSDTFCYVVDASRFRAALGDSPRLRSYASDYLAALLHDSRRALALALAGRSHDETLANRPLRALIAREPVTCPPTAAVRQALTRMHEARIGSILVVDDRNHLVGILTRHDVLGRVALAQRDLDDPVTSVMTPQPIALDAQASAHDAALLIAREGIRHVPVISDGRVIGVVTERDLFALQTAGIRTVRRSIVEARTVAALVQASTEVRALTRRLHDAGLAPEPLTRIISSLNDAITEGALRLHRADHDLDGLSWTWLAFGSEGRLEQTVSTDQDNGIVFDAVAPDAGSALEPSRERLVAYARSVNDTLDTCGFPRCKGGIMAGNPRWCLSVDEWREAFARWIATPEPGELLSAVIFFDFRALHGPPQHVAAMRAALFELVRRHPGFLRQLAAYACESRPPLGPLGGLRGDASAAPGTMDLKLSGARFFVDAARVLALRAEVASTNTAERIRDAGARLGMNERDVRSAVDAFFFVQGLRLRNQLGAGPPDRPNRIVLSSLSEVDARMLKESLRQARNLQSLLALEYRL